MIHNEIKENKAVPILGRLGGYVACHADSQGNSVLGGGSSLCKGPEVGCCLARGRKWALRAWRTVGPWLTGFPLFLSATGTGRPPAPAHRPGGPDRGAPRNLPPASGAAQAVADGAQLVGRDSAAATSAQPWRFQGLRTTPTTAASVEPVASNVTFRTSPA